MNKNIKAIVADEINLCYEKYIEAKCIAALTMPEMCGVGYCKVDNAVKDEMIVVRSCAAWTEVFILGEKLGVTSIEYTKKAVTLTNAYYRWCEHGDTELENLI